MTTRRLLIRGLAGVLVSAPAVVSAASLMRITPTKVWTPASSLSALDYVDVQKAIDVIRQSMQSLTLRFEDWNPLEYAADLYAEDLYRAGFRPKNPNVARWLDS